MSGLKGVSCKSMFHKNEVENLIKNGYETKKFRKSVINIEEDLDLSVHFVPDGYKITKINDRFNIEIVEVINFNDLSDEKLYTISKFWFDADTYDIDVHLTVINRYAKYNVDLEDIFYKNLQNGDKDDNDFS